MNVDAEAVYFIDTNVLVYAYDRSAGKKYEAAVELLKACWEYENGRVSMQVLQEFFVTVTRKIASPLDVPSARQIVADLAQWRLHAPEADDLLQAIDFQQNYQLSFWDAMVVQSAVRLGCSWLVTEDFSHGQVFGGVQVVNPF
jgi:predicted nucleic acid-binding protein